MVPIIQGLIVKWMCESSLTCVSHNVVFKGVPGANPDLLLLNLANEVVEVSAADFHSPTPLPQAGKLQIFGTRPIWV